MNLALGLAAVAAFAGGLFSVAAFALQLRRDRLGEDRHLPKAAVDSISKSLRDALPEDERRRLSIGVYVSEPHRDRDTSEYASAFREPFAVAGSFDGIGGGQMPSGAVPNVGVAVSVDRSQAPNLDLAGIFRNAGIRTTEIPDEPFQGRNYKAALKVFVTDKP